MRLTHLPLLAALLVLLHGWLHAAPQVAHTLVGLWSGVGGDIEGVELALDADGTGRLGAAPLTWSTPRAGRLVYTLDGERTRARTTLTGDRLVITAGDESFTFQRVPARPIVQGFEVPPPLTGAREGAAQRLGHSRGYYTFEVPLAWSLGREDEDGLWVNPGLADGGTLDALIRVSHGELDPEDRGAAPTALVARHTPALVASLRELGVEVVPATASPRAALVGEVPGALQEWRGKQGDGSAVRVWLGGIVKREHFLLVVAVLVDGRADAYLPDLTRLFTSLVVRAPERNAVLETALAARRFKRSETFPGAGSMYSSYAFAPDGQVKKEISMGGRIRLDYDVSGSTEEWGRYEVVEDLVYLYFRDGQQTARAVVEGGALVALRIGDHSYR